MSSPASPAPPSPNSGTSSPPSNNTNTNSNTTSNTNNNYQPPSSIYQSIMSRPSNSHYNSPLSSAHYTTHAALHPPVQLYGNEKRAVTDTPAGALLDTSTAADQSTFNNNNTNSNMNSNGNNMNSMNNSALSLGALTMRSLPYPQPWQRSNAGPSDLPPNFDWMSESCGSKAAIGVIGGGVMGLVMGVFMGALTDMTPPVTVINGKEVPQAPIREQMRTTLRATADKSMYWCRQFAFITGVFGGSECLVEKYRGKHDVWNAVVSGCITGAAMQAKQGPQASAIGCGGFAAFSLVIDSVMGTHS